MVTKRVALGKGLGALLPEFGQAEPKTLLYCGIEEIIATGSQLRKHFDEAKLQELAESIKEKGILEPLIVRRVDHTRRGVMHGYLRGGIQGKSHSLHWEDEHVIRGQKEVPMKSYMETQTLEPSGDTAPVTICVHGRVIDDVLTNKGKRTGQVRCLGCGAIFDDPYQGLR